MNKAAFFDIDGTLVPYAGHCVSKADSDAVEALREQGTLVFIVTGRHICDIDNIPFAVNGAVCCNGARTFVVREGFAHFGETGRFTLVDDHPIPRRQAMDIARIIADNRIPASVSTASVTFSENLTSKALEFIRSVNMPSLRRGSILEAAGRESVYDFNVFVSPEEEKILFKDVLQGLETPRWCDEYCDINVCGLDKVLGIKKILDIYGIGPADTIAFGDGYNDITMLEFVGCGIAMGSADERVRNAADFVTASARECGVSKWLNSDWQGSL